MSTDLKPFWGLKSKYVVTTEKDSESAPGTKVTTKTMNYTDAAITDPTRNSTMWDSGMGACCVSWGSSRPQARDCWDWTLGIGLDAAKCGSCGAKWMPVYSWQSHSRWVVAKWSKEFSWIKRGMNNINTWIDLYPDYAGLLSYYELAAMEVRTQPIQTYISCRTEVRFSTMESLAAGEPKEMKLGESEAFAGVESVKKYSEAFSSLVSADTCPPSGDTKCAQKFDLEGAMDMMNVDGVGVMDNVTTTGTDCRMRQLASKGDKYLSNMAKTHGRDDYSEEESSNARFLSGKNGKYMADAAYEKNMGGSIDIHASDFDEKLDIIRRLAPAHKSGVDFADRKKAKGRKLEAAVANKKVGRLHVDKLSKRMNIRRADFDSDEEWLENRDFALDHDIDTYTKEAMRKLATRDRHNKQMLRVLSMPLDKLRRALQDADSSNTDMPASCYTSVKQDSKYVGQLVGDCLHFQPSVALNAPVEVTFKVLPDIGRNAAFTQIDLGKQDTSVTDTMLLAPMGTTSASLDATGEKMKAKVKETGIYCPIMRYATYIGADVTSADNSCANLDAINAAIAARVLAFGSGDCRSFDCAFGAGGASASLGANGKVGNKVAHLLKAADTRTTTLAPGSSYFLVNGAVGFKFTIPASDTPSTLMANSKFTGMLISGLATALQQAKAMVSLKSLAFGRRRLTADGRQEVTVTLNTAAVQPIHKAQQASEKKARRQLAALEHDHQMATQGSERAHLSQKISAAQRRLDQVTSAHRRKLGEQDIDTNYQVRVADAAAGNDLLGKIAAGSAGAFESALKAAIENIIANDPELAAAYAVLGVTSKGGSVQAAVEGVDPNAQAAAKVKNAAATSKSLLGVTALVALFVMHAVHMLF